MASIGDHDCPAGPRKKSMVPIRWRGSYATHMVRSPPVVNPSSDPRSRARRVSSAGRIARTWPRGVGESQSVMLPRSYAPFGVLR